MSANVDLSRAVILAQEMLEVANVLIARVDSDLIRTRDYEGSVEWNDSMGAALADELVRLLPEPTGR